MTQTKIQIVTDSASDVPEELLKRYNIDMVPLTIHFGTKEYLDREDLSTKDFYQLLELSKDLPSTNQVNPNQFVSCFRKHLDQGKTILYVGISLKLSGTTQSATLAKEMLAKENIHVFDTCSASLGEGIQVLRAAKKAEETSNVEEILRMLEEHKKQSFGYFVLESLQHLVRGGRLSKAQAVVGSILNIKPILAFEKSGEIHVAEKVRSRKKALQVILDRAKEHRKDFSDLDVAVVHTNTLEGARELTEMVQEELRPREIVTGLVGATIATHVGPGGVGLFF